MKVSFYLTRYNSKTETSIYALVNYEGFKVKYYTTESILPIHWNKESKRAKKSFREHPEFNERLNQITTDIQTIYRKYLNDHKNRIPPPDKLKAIFDKELKKIETPEELSKSFFPFFKNIIELTKTGKRLQPLSGKRYSPATIQVYNNTYNRLIEFQKTRKRKIDFDTIDIDFYTDLNEYLSGTLNLATNTIGKDIKTLKTIMNEATDRGINKNLQFRAKKFSTTTENTDSIYLNESELKDIEELDLTDNPRLDSVRDLFLVGCYTGLRFSDFSILTPGEMKDGFIEIKEQTKTGNPVVIPVHSVVDRIVNKYGGVLPKCISNQRFNDYLKEIGKLVKSLETPFIKTITKGGLKISHRVNRHDMLTTHTARRSFATNEYLNGMPTLTIMAITGHKTEKAFMRYIKLTPNEHAKLMKLHWENRNKLRAV